MLTRICLLLCLFVFPFHAAAAPTEYKLLRDQSRVGFTWFLGQDAITGQMPVARADIVLDFDRIGNSKVNVAVNAAQARAGAPFAGEAMKGQSVLWTDRHPEILFKSTNVKRDGSGGALIDGELTVRGVTRPQRFTARLFRPAGTKVGDRSNLTIRLEGVLSREAFGADGFQSFVGDRVELGIRARIAEAQ